MPRVPSVAKSLMLRARRAVAHTFGGAQGRTRACLQGRPRPVRSHPVSEQACGYVIRGCLASHQDLLKVPAGLRAQGPKQVTECGVFVAHRLVHQPTFPCSCFAIRTVRAASATFSSARTYPLRVPDTRPTSISHVARQDAARRVVRVSRRPAIHRQSKRPAGGA